MQELTDRQNEIVDATLKLIATKGIQELTIRKLARSLGLTEGALYRHFSGKTAIIQALVQRFEHEVLIPPALNGWDAIEDFIIGRIRQIINQPDLALVMYSEKLFHDSDETRAMIRNMMDRHKAWLTKHFQYAIFHGQITAEIELDNLFRIVIGPLRLMVKQWGITSRKFDLLKKEKELLHIIRNLLRPK